jgi:hypothetical protein
VALPDARGLAPRQHEDLPRRHRPARPPQRSSPRATGSAPHPSLSLIRRWRRHV